MSCFGWIVNMLRNGPTYSVCSGLEVSVADGVAGMAFPRAAISLHAVTTTREDDDYSGDAIMVRLSPSRLRMLLGNGPMAEALLADDVAEFHIDNPALVRRIAMEILQSDYKDDCLRIYLRGKVVELLVDLLARPQGQGGKSPAMAARDILLRDPVNPPTMGELSRLVGVSQRQLSSEFKKAFGQTVPVWLAEWRLTRGHDLVLGGSIPMAEIATSLGYSHLSTFTSAFTKRFGAAPTCLRAGSALKAEASP